MSAKENNLAQLFIDSENGTGEVYVIDLNDEFLDEERDEKIRTFGNFSFEFTCRATWVNRKRLDYLLYGANNWRKRCGLPMRHRKRYPHEKKTLRLSEAKRCRGKTLD